MQRGIKTHIHAWLLHPGCTPVHPLIPTFQLTSPLMTSLFLFHAGSPHSWLSASLLLDHLFSCYLDHLPRDHPPSSEGCLTFLWPVLGCPPGHALEGCCHQYPDRRWTSALSWESSFPLTLPLTTPHNTSWQFHPLLSPLPEADAGTFIQNFMLNILRPHKIKLPINTNT